MAYQVYITDALKAMTENTAKYAGGSVLRKRFVTLLDEAKNPVPVDDRSAEEIIARIRAKLKKYSEEGD